MPQPLEPFLDFDGPVLGECGASPALTASFEGGQACVCDLADPFDVTQPTISHHLRVLR